MFFRREKAKIPAFSDRIANLKQYGFTVKPEGNNRVLVTRDDIGAIVTDVPGDKPLVERLGLFFCGEIGQLVNGGYQQFWLMPSKKRLPARAEHLKALHAFEEDLKEGLGLMSLYNTSLGTVSALHMYDRVEERDVKHEHKPWEVRIAPEA